MSQALLRLMTWLSPSFPVGGFSWSHGLEFAVEAGLVHDRATTTQWIRHLMEHGSQRLDADLFLRAHACTGHAALDAVTGQAEAWRGTAELAQESATQGAAFLAAVLAAWPDPELERWQQRLKAEGRRPAYAVAVGHAAARAGIGAFDALAAYLHGFVANQVSAALRLVPLGQSDGLRVLAALEPLIPGAVEAAMARPPGDMGSAAPMLDWCSMRHETQYTRLFRS